ncbi:MAG: EAL domain-containing protein [Actinomycetota bacterium]|nr:EAL domain-containing protein [Actinomycetota bacterium]
MRDDGDLAGAVIVGTGISAENGAEDTMDLLSAIVECSRDAIVGMDLSGLVTSCNPGGEELFGVKADEVLGSGFASLGVGDSTGEVKSAMESLAQGGDTGAVEFVRLDNSGGEVPVESTLYPVRSAEGSLVGAAAVVRDSGPLARDTTDYHDLEQMAQEDRRRLEEAQRVARVGSFEFDLVSGVSVWSREFRRLIGVGAGEAADYSAFLSRVHGDDAERFLADIGSWLAGTERLFETDIRVVPEAGVVRWLALRAEVLRDHDGGASKITGSIQDLTDQRADSRARQLAEEQFAATFDLGVVGMLVTDLQSRILRANTAFCRLVGRQPEEVNGRTPNEFAHPSERDDPGLFSADRMARSGVDHTDVERRFVRPDGRIVHTEVHVSTVRDDHGEPEYFFCQVVDITDRKRVEGELQRLAMHDPLTGLPNRYLLQDRLETALARAQRSQHRVVVLFVDVDRFKLVNDSLGHATGDSLLVQVADRLARESRSGDTVARFGGDEFVMVCEDVVDTLEAQRIGERVLRLFDDPFFVADQQLYVTASTGIVVAATDATPVTVLRDADAAMYLAKERGRSRAEMFDEGLRHRAAKRLDIEIMLRHALERGEFRLTYQPVVSLPGNVPVGVEALLRWEHPERGTLSPNEFIPAAEETGLISAIGAWALETALAQVAGWRRLLPGADDLYVAVNLSPRQLLSGDLLARCQDAISQHRLPADALCLELTEGAVMQAVDMSVPILRKLSESGIRIAVDDFGAGYSSLSYLKRLPVSSLKIDRSFVDGIPHDSDDAAIVRAIVSLGYALGLEVCAEGVETPAQRAELVRLGCHLGQGYFWAPAMRPEAFADWHQRRAGPTSSSA